MKQNSNFSNLATKIALNQIFVSLGEKKVNSKIIKEIYRNEEIVDNLKSYAPQRFIVIVGAGASNNASDKLKLGKDAAKVIEKKF